MFREIVKDLYIGKSKLTLECNQKEIPQTTLVQDVLQNTGFTGNMPDYGTYGNFKDGKFEITPMMPKHCLFITGVLALILILEFPKGQSLITSELGEPIGPLIMRMM